MESGDPTAEVVLRPVTALSFRDLAEVWRHRELLWILALRDVRVRYKQAALGAAWALLQPLAQMVIFTLLFHRLAGIDGDLGVPYPVFCFSGLTVWLLFAGGLTRSSESLVESANLVTKVYFPRVIVPLAATVAALLDFAVAFALLLVMMLGYRLPIHATILLAPVIGACAALCAIALGLWTSALNMKYRDVRYALPFFIQLLIYLSPVFYPSSLIPPRYRLLIALNPMAAVIDSFRAALFGGPLPLERLVFGLLFVLAVALVGFLWFRRVERTFADQV